MFCTDVYYWVSASFYSQNRPRRRKFWLSTDFSSASDKTVVIEKFESYDISVEEVFSPDSNKKAFEILQQTTVEKAKLPFGIVLTSDKHREKELYRLRLTTLDESLPKTSYS